MEIETKIQDVEMEGVDTIRQMGLNNNPIIWRFLTDQLYTQQNAWINEYAQNARDVDPDWRIVLPTDFVPEVRFVDNGPSMSKDFMLNEFCQAGFSTKRHTNSQSGGFGIGRLSGPQGTIFECRNEDMIRIYSLIKSEESIPSIVLLEEKPRGGVPIGVTVRVPVDPTKIQAVTKDIEKFLRFYGLPNLPQLKWINKTPTWGLIDHNTTDRYRTYPALVVIGGYSFEVRQNDIESSISHLPEEDRKLLSRFFVELKGVQVVMFLPVGSVQVALNRESIKFEENGVNAMLAVVREVSKEFTDKMQKQFDECATLWNANETFNYMKSNDVFHYANPAEFTYKGQKIDGVFRVLKDELPLVDHYSSYKYKRSSGQKEYATNFSVSPRREPQHPSQWRVEKERPCHTFHPQRSDDPLTICVMNTTEEVSRRFRNAFPNPGDRIFLLYPKQEWKVKYVLHTPGPDEYVPPVLNKHEEVDPSLYSRVKIESTLITHDQGEWWTPLLAQIDGCRFQIVKLADFEPIETEYQRKKRLGLLPKRETNLIRNTFFTAAVVRDEIVFSGVDVDLNAPEPRLWVPFYRNKLDEGDEDKGVPSWKDKYPHLDKWEAKALMQYTKHLYDQPIIGVPRNMRSKLPSNWINFLDFARSQIRSDHQEIMDHYVAEPLNGTYVTYLENLKSRLTTPNVMINDFLDRSEDIKVKKRRAETEYKLGEKFGIVFPKPTVERQALLDELKVFIGTNRMLTLLIKINPYHLTDTDWHTVVSFL